jgi:methionine-rich copper-binding protein CopC
MKSGLRVAAVTAVLAATLAPAPARAGERSLVASSVPTAGTVVRGAPPVVTLRLTTPVDQVSATVLDGCGQPVPSDVAVAGKRVSIRLAVSHTAAGHPDHTAATGMWRVSWRASGTRGATAAGDLPFTVGSATADCAPPVAAPAVPARTGPDLPLLLYAVAALGVLLTCARLAIRKSHLFPESQTG